MYSYYFFISAKMCFHQKALLKRVPTISYRAVLLRGRGVREADTSDI